MNTCLKFLTFLKLLKKLTKIFSNFLDLKIFGCKNLKHFLISIPKCIKLNFKSKH